MNWGVSLGACCAALAAVLGLVGCAGDDECKSEPVRVCACGSEQGTQSCEAGSWSPCDCSGSNGNGGNSNVSPPQGVGAQFGDGGQDMPPYSSGGQQGSGTVDAEATASVVNNHEGCSVYVRLDGGERVEILAGEAHQFPATVGTHSISITGGSLDNGDLCEVTSGKYQCDMVLGDNDNAAVTVSSSGLTGIGTSCPQCSGSTGDGSGEAFISLVNDNRNCTVGIRIDGGAESVVMPESVITLPVDPGSHSISIDTVGTSAEGECSLGHIGGPQCDVELAAGDHKSLTLSNSSLTVYGVTCWSCGDGGGDPSGDPPACFEAGRQCSNASQCCSNICGGSFPTTCG